MAITKSFSVLYEVVYLSSGQGAKYKYRKGPVPVNVVASAASGVAGVLASDVSLNAGESIEILDIHENANAVGTLT